MTLRRLLVTGGMAVLVGCIVPPQATASSPAPSADPPAPADAARFVLSGAVQQGGMVVGCVPAGTVSLALDGAAVPIAADGHFLIAFGRDHGPAAMLTATRADGSAVVDHLVIAPGVYRIEALPIPAYKQPPAEFLRIREGELAQIHHARDVAVSVQSDGWEQRFAWPVHGRVSGAFGAQRVYDGQKGSFHAGEDIAVPIGTPVRAPADGVVLLADTGTPFTLEGHLLMVGHGMGLDSAFLHLSHIDVQVGDVVHKGEVIAESGMTGRATGPHLHWALTWRGERIDPKLVAGPMPEG